MQWQIDPTNLGEVLACAGIARLSGAAPTGFDGNTFRAPDDALAALEPSLAPTEYGLALCGHDIDWWQPWGLNKVMKNWSGQQTPQTVHQESVRLAEGVSPADWRHYTAPSRGQLYVDALATWDAQTVGWSLNEQKPHQIAGRPWLEILASLGLQAFPVPGSRRDGFTYRLWRPLPLIGAVAAFTGHGPGIYSSQAYRAPTAKSGQVTYLRPAVSI
jgi:hypothetical protein